MGLPGRASNFRGSIRVLDYCTTSVTELFCVQPILARSLLALARKQLQFLLSDSPAYSAANTTTECIVDVHQQLWALLDNFRTSVGSFEALDDVMLVGSPWMDDGT